MRSTSPDLGLGRGNEAAGLGEEDEESDLANVGAFAGHVGAGENDESGGVGVERGVVGHEAPGGHRLVEDGVASVGDFDCAGGGEYRPDVAEGAGGFGQSGEGVDLGDGAGGLLERCQLGEDGGAELSEDFRLEGAGAFFAAEDATFHFFQLGGDEALRVGGGLFAGVVVGDGGEVGFGHFEVVTEDGVVADFEGLDAGAGDFAILQFGDPAASFGPGTAEFVEIRVVACADHAAVSGGGRRLVDHGGFEEGNQRVEGAEVGGEGEERGIVVFSEGGAKGRKEGEGSFQRDEIPGVAGGEAEAGDGAFHVADVAEDVAHRGEAGGVIMQGGNEVLAVRDGGEIAERMEDPFAQQAGAHRSEGAVDGAAEAGPFGVAGFDQFEVGLGHGIEEEVGCRMPGFGGARCCASRRRLRVM